ncbi:MAG: imidazole glycerol phosphate synthase subunit HisH [Candidatus Margulisiibacteriota bacterium]
MPIAIIDYGSGNLRSVEKALEKLGFEAIVTSDNSLISTAEGIILPGVGAFDSAILELRERQLDSIIKEEIGKGKPFLGLCLGMQLLFESSEEGEKKGLGIIKGLVKKFSKGTGYRVQGTDTSENNASPHPAPCTPHPIKIPQIGWNNIKLVKTASPIVKGIPDSSMMYFVHSYYCEPQDKDVILATTDYGITFASAVEKGNLFAFQFHPEKSSDTGLKLLKNFGDICKTSSR